MNYLERYWNGSNSRFQKCSKNAKWLEECFGIPKAPGPGAPVKSFKESSDRSKRRKIFEVTSHFEDLSPNRSIAAAKNCFQILQILPRVQALLKIMLLILKSYPPLILLMFFLAVNFQKVNMVL